MFGIVSIAFSFRGTGGIFGCNWDVFLLFNFPLFYEIIQHFFFDSYTVNLVFYFSICRSHEAVCWIPVLSLFGDSVFSHFL